jgi:hypothetical protein
MRHGTQSRRKGEPLTECRWVLACEARGQSVLQQSGGPLTQIRGAHGSGGHCLSRPAPEPIRCAPAARPLGTGPLRLLRTTPVTCGISTSSTKRDEEEQKRTSRFSAWGYRRQAAARGPRVAPGPAAGGLGPAGSYTRHKGKSAIRGSATARRPGVRLGSALLAYLLPPPICTRARARCW